MASVRGPGRAGRGWGTGPAGRLAAVAVVAATTVLPAVPQDLPAGGGGAGQDALPPQHLRLERPPARRRPPVKLSTTLNMDGEPAEVKLSGVSYRGVRVTHVGSEGVAASAELRPGDVLLSLNGRAVTDPEMADRVLARIGSGNLGVAFARPSDGTYRFLETRVRYVNPYREAAKVLVAGKALPPASIADMELRLISLINLDRSGAGQSPLPPVEHDAGLSRLARQHAEDMAQRQFFSHTTPDGKTFAERVRGAGIRGPAAENLHTGALSVEEAQTGFMSEPPDVPGNHRDNILNPIFRYAGVAVVRNKDNTLLVVEIFSASPSGGGAAAPAGASGADRRD